MVEIVKGLCGKNCLLIVILSYVVAVSIPIVLFIDVLGEFEETV